ncbi:hypothetical protein LCGC14_3075530, partial [marine sediment metagenome]
MELSDYSKIHQLYHREVHRMQGHQVVVQEKIDGSQISFGKKDGELFVRSKNQMINLDDPEKMFANAVGVLKSKDPPEGYVFRGEYLKIPKHNVLKYDRIPQDHIIIYDIEDGDGSNYYLDPSLVEDIAADYGFEVVPTFAETDFCDVNQSFIDICLENISILGGPLVEGIVIKCYDLFDSRDKTLMCKYVRPEFREMISGKQGKNRRDIIEEIGERLAIPARFDKAFHQADEQGLITGEPKDIGPMMKILNTDFEEHVDEIKNLLYANFRKDIMKVASRGFPKFYKAKLLTDSNVLERVTTPCTKCQREIEKHESTAGLCIPCHRETPNE